LIYLVVKISKKGLLMGEQIAEIKTVILPELFRHPDAIGHYGRTNVSHEAMTELGHLMDQSPVSRLATEIAEIVAKLSDANPRRLFKSSTWLEFKTGFAILDENVELMFKPVLLM
jgi:hypothetical protein